jgi:tripartite-type tricarboxylate transporter receptor subunit TctC
MLKDSIVLGAFLTGALMTSSLAIAQEWPTKQPIKIIVGVPPGGGTDGIARVTADYLRQRLNQAVIVENKPGASSTIGAEYVFKAPPDGYTILLVGPEIAVVPATRSVRYKLDQFTYLIRPYTIPPLLIASPKASFSNFPEFLAELKAKPDQLKYGSTGIGAVVHVGVSMFTGAANVKALHVPYSGIAPVYGDLFTGQIDFSMSTPPFPDNLKILASAGTKRHPAYPNAQTLDELGIKGASWDVPFGFYGPPNLPKPIADRLSAEIAAVTRDPEAIAKYTNIVKMAPDKEPLLGEAFKKQTLEDAKKWKAVIDREKIVVE